MSKLTVLYDTRCRICLRRRNWLEAQSAFLELEFVSRTSPEVRRRFPSLAALDRTDELVVIDNEGGVYRGPSAFVICLYALRDYREVSLWLGQPALLPLARWAFQVLSERRGLLSWFFARSCPEAVVGELRRGAARTAALLDWRLHCPARGAENARPFGDRPQIP
jgi:predicted DCC family thiol-disulfide oxidoreductase YuxK